MSPFKIKRACTLLTLFCCISILCACEETDKHSGRTTPKASTDNTITVETASLTRVDLAESIVVTGSVLASKTTNLVPTVGGLIEEIYVKVGDKVEQGDPLLQLRQSDFELNVERLTHARDLARAELEDAERDLDSAVHLSRKEVFSKEQLEDRQTRVSVSKSKLGIAEADLAKMLKELEDSIVRAPYRGVITKRFVDEGAFVPTVMRSERPVLQIQKIDIVVILLSIPERHLSKIKVGMPGQVHIPSLSTTYDSEVVLINDRLDLKTRTIDVRLGLRNPDYTIKPGLFAKVELTPQSRAALILPSESVLGTTEDHFVYVIENGKAIRKPVQVSELQDGRLELVSGLDRSATIIVGQSRHQLQGDIPVEVESTSHVDS